MKNSLLLFLSLLLLSMIACERNENADLVDIEVSNNTDNTIEVAYLSTIYNEAKTKESKIDPHSILKTKIDFSKVGKSDGSYSLHFKYADSIDYYRKDFGYYTNGYPLDSKFIIAIHKDTIIINNKPRNLSSY